LKKTIAFIGVKAQYSNIHLIADYNYVNCDYFIVYYNIVIEPILFCLSMTSDLKM